MTNRILLKAVLAAALVAAEGWALSDADPLAAREKGRQWLAKAKFGVFVHYLGEGDDWNDKVNYTAGEQNSFAATPESNAAPDGMQWHILSFLGTNWARNDGPTNSGQYMIDYIKTVNAQGGVVTIDVNISYDGKIYEPHLRQLLEIGKAVR